MKTGTLRDLGPGPLQVRNGPKVHATMANRLDQIRSDYISSSHTMARLIRCKQMLSTVCCWPYIMDLPLRRALANACCSLTEKPQASARYALRLPYLHRMCCRVACITGAGACENFRASKPTSFFKLRSLFRSGIFLDLHPRNAPICMLQHSS